MLRTAVWKADAFGSQLVFCAGLLAWPEAVGDVGLNLEQQVEWYWLINTWISSCKLSLLNPVSQSIWPFLWTFKKNDNNIPKRNFSTSHWMSQASFFFSCRTQRHLVIGRVAALNTGILALEVERMQKTVCGCFIMWAVTKFCMHLY